MIVRRETIHIQIIAMMVVKLATLIILYCVSLLWIPFELFLPVSILLLILLVRIEKDFHKKSKLEIPKETRNTTSEDQANTARVSSLQQQ
jgi:membrane protein implicated in regulation of membrane protease activity